MIDRTNHHPDRSCPSFDWGTQEQTATDAYHRSGVVVLTSFMSPDELTDTRRHLTRYVRELAPTLPPMDVICKKPGDLQTVTMLSRMSNHDPYFHEMLHSSKLCRLADTLFGCPAVPQNVEFFNKPPHSDHGTPAHQDGYYFHLTPCEALTLWMPLERVDEENGCVRYVTGSNHDGLRAHGRTEVVGFSQSLLDYNDHDRIREVSACVEPGDMIVHDALTIHRADSNRSDLRDRPAVAFVYFSQRAQIDREQVAAYQQLLESDLRAKGKI